MDITERLRALYVEHGTNYVQEAADEIERLRACISETVTRAERAEAMHAEAFRVAIHHQDDARAVRELMNIHNLGGWTDALGPMKRALAAEAERDTWKQAAEARQGAEEKLRDVRAYAEELVKAVYRVLCESNGVFDNEWRHADGTAAPEFPVPSFCEAIRALDSVYSRRPLAAKDECVPETWPQGDPYPWIVREPSGQCWGPFPTNEAAGKWADDNKIDTCDFEDVMPPAGLRHQSCTQEGVCPNCGAYGKDLYKAAYGVPGVGKHAPDCEIGNGHQVNRWIPVGERMPLTPYEDEAKRHVESDRLLVRDKGGLTQIATAIQYSDGEYCWCLGGFPGADMTVTHWMPIPELEFVAGKKP